MHAVQSSRRLVSWIAACAILFGALAPTLTQALARLAWREAPVVQVCTAHGLQAVGVAPGKHGKQSGLTVAHCPYCSIHAASFGLPPPAEVAFAPLGGGDPLLPERFYRAPAPLFAWAPAHPRAPPVRA